MHTGSHGHEKKKDPRPPKASLASGGTLCPWPFIVARTDYCPVACQARYGVDAFGIKPFFLSCGKESGNWSIGLKLEKITTLTD
jgi:hypothetical protein